MIKTPLSTVLGGAFWTPSTTIVGDTSKTFNQIIKSLFANNEQGFAYDPNDLSTMFQDSAGTVPVTAVGQPVGLILDKSGRGNHARQTTSASRPILRQNVTTGAYYLEFDGSDDFLVTNSINFTSTDKVSLFAGVRKLLSTSSVLIELSNTIANTGTFSIQAPRFGDSYGVSVRGTTLNAVDFYTYTSPLSNVISVKTSTLAVNYNQAVNVKINGAAVAGVANSSATSTGNYGNYPLYIGRRGGTSIPFTGHIYSIVGVGRLATDAETTELEKLIAKNTGVTLSV
ncbi:hypothetical protein EJP75_08390 [Acinetobacter baumannii]|nr:hypothetical protein EJP75_08390 [Acinetobacter baumannii]